MASRVLVNPALSSFNRRIIEISRNFYFSKLELVDISQKLNRFNWYRYISILLSSYQVCREPWIMVPSKYPRHYISVKGVPHLTVIATNCFCLIQTILLIKYHSTYQVSRDPGISRLFALDMFASREKLSTTKDTYINMVVSFVTNSREKESVSWTYSPLVSRTEFQERVLSHGVW